MTLLLIPLLPFLAAVLLLFFGRRLGKASAAVALLALLGSFLLSVRLFLKFLTTQHPIHASLEWLPFAGSTMQMGFLADPLSITLCLVVTVIGWLILFYSVGYMGQDPRFSQFFATMSLFCGSMLTLVLADNFILLYIGWELVGLCSYLLIGFWFEKEAAANAAKKAFLTTRVGDLGLFAAILLIAQIAGSLSFMDLKGTADALGPWVGLVALLIFLGAAGKSAQFPLHVWLPDAMEGPASVSALIHAATMVVAGVYLVARTLPLFLSAPESLLVVAAIGGLTSFFAATIACTQTDLKRILAYSTISQLGFMMLGLGAGSQFAGIFHLVTHAWFKALLFLGAGSVIHALHHQDVTRMGGLWRSMPITALTFTLAAVAMAGIPPFSGFWSKEGILMGVAGNLPPVFLMLALAISFLTAFYIFRAVILTFFGSPRETASSHEAGASDKVAGASGAASDSRSREAGASDKVAGASGAASDSRSQESPFVMTGPLIALAIGAVGMGFIASPLSGHFYQQFLGGPSHPPEGFAWLELVSVVVAACGILLAFLRYQFKVLFLTQSLRQMLSPLYRVVANKYYVDELYEAVLIRPLLAFSKKAFSFDARVIDGAVNRAGEAGLSLSRIKRWVDERLVDGFVNGLAAVVGWTGGTVRLIQTGLIQNYLLVAVIGGVVIFLLLRGNL